MKPPHSVEVQEEVRISVALVVVNDWEHHCLMEGL